MKNIYQPRQAFLQSVHPFMKFFAGLALILWMTLTKEKNLWLPPVLLGEMVLLLVLLGGLRWSQVRPLIPIAIWVVIGYLFLYTMTPMRPGLVKNATLWLRWGPVTLGPVTLRLGATTALRVIAYLGVSMLFVATTSMDRLLLACVHHARLPYRVGYAIIAAMRSVPCLHREWQTMRTAHRLRGFGVGGGVVRRFRAVLRLAFPLLVRTLRRAQQTALAMESRAFGAFPTRTYLQTLRFTWRDGVFLGAFVLWHAGLFWVGEWMKWKL